MPKKLNFLGGMQNYNEHNGEYEPALTGANGKVVTDADGDGKTHEGKKQTYDKMRKVLAKEGYPVDSYSDEEVDRAFTSLEKSIDAEDDKWRNKQKEKEKLTFDKVIKSADDDILDEEFGKDSPERKLVGAIKEDKDDNYDEINEALADYEYEITDKTTVGDYAQRIAEKTGSSKEEVLSVLKKSSGKEFKETDKMSIVADLEEEQDFSDPGEAAHNKAEEQEFNAPKKQETETKDSQKSITYDEFFESPTNKQIVDDYVSDYFDRAKRQGEQANISADQIVEEFKKDWNGFYSDETLPLIKERIQDKIGYPKGTSKEYTQKINKQFDESYKTLKEKYGFTDEQLSNGKIDETIEGFIQGWENADFAGGKRKWTKEEHQEIYKLLDIVEDKHYNDSFIKKAPYGF